MSRYPTTPKLCRQRERSTPDRAYVLLNGREIHLGRWGTKRARTEYHRLLSEWEAGGRNLATGDPDTITVKEVIAAYWKYAERVYQRHDIEHGRELMLLDRCIGKVADSDETTHHSFSQSVVDCIQVGNTRGGVAAARHGIAHFPYVCFQPWIAAQRPGKAISGGHQSRAKAPAQDDPDDVVGVRGPEALVVCIRVTEVVDGDTLPAGVTNGTVQEHVADRV